MHILPPQMSLSTLKRGSKCQMRKLLDNNTKDALETIQSNLQGQPFHDPKAVALKGLNCTEKGLHCLLIPDETPEQLKLQTEVVT